MTLTWDVANRVMPSCSTSFSIRRVDTADGGSGQLLGQMLHRTGPARSSG